MTELRRDLTLVHGIAIVVGITIGTGIFLKSAPMAQAVGSPLLVMVAWAVAGLVAVLGALCFAELGTLMPRAGGEYQYVRAAFGDLHHAIGSGLMRSEDVRAELADVVSGRKRGRLSPEEIVVFDSTGTALQDVAAAALVYERALAGGIGLPVHLGSTRDG